MKRVVVVGVGALGSHAVLFLRNAGGALRLVDFDRVEQKNVLSQFHGRPTVGKNKAAALAAQMLFLFGQKLDAVPHMLTKDNAAELLGDAALVVDALDDGPSRRVIQQFVRKANVPCVHGALAANGAFGRVVWDEAFVADDAAEAGAATCEDGGHLPFIAVVAGYLAQAAREFLASGEQKGFHVHPAGAHAI